MFGAQNVIVKVDDYEDPKGLTGKKAEGTFTALDPISKENIKASFKDLTRLYDFVWYGNFEIDESKFVKVAANFEATTNLINNK